MDGTEVNTSAIVPGEPRFETGDLLYKEFIHPTIHSLILLCIGQAGVR